MSGGPFFAESGDDEQAVVDRQAQPQDRRQIQRIVRHRGEIGEQGEQADRADDRTNPNDEREPGGDKAAEHQHEQQKNHRYRDQLARREVIGELFGDIDIADGLPAQLEFQRAAARSAEGVDQMRGHLIGGSFIAFDVRHDQGAGSVAAAQRLRLAGAPVGHDGIDTGRVGELLGDRLTGGDGVGLVDGSATGVGRKDDEVGLAGVKSLRQKVGGTA